MLLGNPFLASFGGPLILALGASVATPVLRRHLSGPRLVGAGIAVGIATLLVTDSLIGTSIFQRSLSLTAALLPIAVALGWLDAGVIDGDRTLANRVFFGLSVAIVGLLVVSAPLRALGGRFSSLHRSSSRSLPSGSWCSQCRSICLALPGRVQN